MPTLIGIQQFTQNIHLSSSIPDVWTKLPYIQSNPSRHPWDLISLNMTSLRPPSIEYRFQSYPEICWTSSIQSLLLPLTINSIVTSVRQDQYKQKFHRFHQIYPDIRGTSSVQIWLLSKPHLSNLDFQSILTHVGPHLSSQNFPLSLSIQPRSPWNNTHSVKTSVRVDQSCLKLNQVPSIKSKPLFNHQPSPADHSQPSVIRPTEFLSFSLPLSINSSIQTYVYLHSSNLDSVWTLIVSELLPELTHWITTSRVTNNFSQDIHLNISVQSKTLPYIHCSNLLHWHLQVPGTQTFVHQVSDKLTCENSEIILYSFSQTVNSNNPSLETQSSFNQSINIPIGTSVTDSNIPTGTSIPDVNIPSSTLNEDVSIPSEISIMDTTMQSHDKFRTQHQSKRRVLTTKPSISQSNHQTPGYHNKLQIKLFSIRNRYHFLNQSFVS